MVPELEEMQKLRITEIQVRMDCNGCIQKIKKALNGIDGICDLYINFPQQKLTVVGWADPEKIVKAIKKTRKIATICTHVEPSDPPAPSAEPAPEGEQPAPDDANPLTETLPTEFAPPPEPPKDPPLPEIPAPEVTPSSIAAETSALHVINHHYPHDYGYRSGHGGRLNNYPYEGQESPFYVTHSYNIYKPSPYISDDRYIRSPPRQTCYSRMEYSNEDYQNCSDSDGNNITSMFSDENPNACTIV